MTKHTWKLLKTLSGYPGELRHIWVIAEGSQVIADCGENEDAAKMMVQSPDLLVENKRLLEALEKIRGTVTQHKDAYGCSMAREIAAAALAGGEDD